MQHVTAEPLGDFRGPWQTDAGVTARFYTREVPNPRFGKDEGADRYINVPYIEAFPEGDYHRSRIDRKVTEMDHERWRDAWQAFEKGARGGHVGTPLREWAYLTAPKIRELQEQGILTVEQIANMPDRTAMGTLGQHYREIRMKALEFIKPDEANSALKAENRELRSRVEQMEAKLSAMESFSADERPAAAVPAAAQVDIEALIEAKLAAVMDKRGPGRPRKQQEVAA